MIQIADPKMKEIYLTAASVAQSRGTVLISGESGTGKEMLARYVHQRSPRGSRRMVAINCAAVPEGLLESELFGAERGSYTGADKLKIGKFELAHESTFLLDEVSELAPSLQAKLLRVIQEGEIERLGGTIPIKINVRLIATSNRPLEQMVREGTFREDLYYRLNVIPLDLPPLRARPLDVENLARTFVLNSCQENEIPPKVLLESARLKLKSYAWPGNVRELQNVIERTVLLTPGAQISDHHVQLPEGAEIMPEADPDAIPSGTPLRPGMTVEEAERLLIFKTLEHTGQNRTRAAVMLGISIRTLRNKLNEYRGGVVETHLR